MPQVAGVDGYPGGWVTVTWDGSVTALTCLPDFAAVLDHARHCAALGVDMPIGFRDETQAGGRECERAARLFVGAGKASSVFSSPVRAALAQPTYPLALQANRQAGPVSIGLSKQTWCLFPKMRDIDAVMTPALQARCKEIHPEVSFAELRNQVAPANPFFAKLDRKVSQIGQDQRERLLKCAGFTNLSRLIAAGKAARAKPDDVLDACAAAWTAQRIFQGYAVSLPATPPHDSRGLEMAIWY